MVVDDSVGRQEASRWWQEARSRDDDDGTAKPLACLNARQTERRPRERSDNDCLMVSCRYVDSDREVGSIGSAGLAVTVSLVCLPRPRCGPSSMKGVTIRFHLECYSYCYVNLPRTLSMNLTVSLLDFRPALVRYRFWPLADLYHNDKRILSGFKRSDAFTVSSSAQR
jgi:hypothetical protein